MPAFNFTNEIILENDRAKIRPLCMEDLQLLLPIALAHENLLAYSPSQIHTEDFLKKYMETALKAKANEVRFPFIIFDKLKGKFAGSTSFGNVSNKDSRLEIGWTWIGLDFQGTGLNGACKDLLMTYAFETLKFERVEFKIDSRNKKSRRAVEKLGAKFEGELRSHTLMSDGYRRNTVYYGILKAEWEALYRN